MSTLARAMALVPTLSLGLATVGCARDAKPPSWQAPASLPWRERIDQEWQAVDEQVGQAVRERRIVGAEVAIVTPEGWSARGFGWATGKGQPNERTVYEIGSVSKVFTGTLLGDMVLRREVQLGQPAQTLLPSGVSMPRSATRPITLLDLTTHMSGLPRLPPNMRRRNPEDPYADFTTDNLYEALGKTRLETEPGTANEYSNYAVGLLGQLLVNRADADDYETLLRDRITGPLGMTDTSIVLREDQQVRFAWPHDKNLRRNSPWFIPGLAGAGGIRSTARDMSVFLQAVMAADSPISGAAREALTPRGTPRAGDWDQGLGWVVRRDRTMAWHNGATGGFHTYVGLDLTSSVAVLVLCNTANGEVDGMGAKILKKMKRSIGSQPMTGFMSKLEVPSEDAVAAQDDPGIDVEQLMRDLSAADLAAGDEVAAR